jgi:hypothetical protein
MTRSVILRAAIAAAFAVPAAVAGYHVVLVMSQIGVPSLAWREVVACLGALFIGGTAWTRLTVFTEPRPLEPGGVMENTPQPVLTAAAESFDQAAPISARTRTHAIARPFALSCFSAEMPPFAAHCFFLYAEAFRPLAQHRD